MNKDGNTITHGGWVAHLNRGFTLCQLQVVLGWANDEGQKEIARDMHIEPATVGKHASRVFFKTRKHKAAGALAQLIAEGVITAKSMALLYFCSRIAENMGNPIKRGCSSARLSSLIGRPLHPHGGA